MSVRAPLRPDRTAPKQPRRAAATAAAADVACVLAFVLIGRRSHDEGGSYVAETAKVAASFLIGVAVAWLVVRAWRAPRTLRTGVGVWAVTLIVGMALRPLFGRDVPVSFVVVTAVVLAVFMLGWRALVPIVARRVLARSSK
jgi:peptidoglycan/LPS O-acetylase OafA/YrhL